MSRVTKLERAYILRVISESLGLPIYSAVTRKGIDFDKVPCQSLYRIVHYSDGRQYNPLGQQVLSMREWLSAVHIMQAVSCYQIHNKE